MQQLKREDFISQIMYHSWTCYQLGCNQPADITYEQAKDSLHDAVSFYEKEISAIRKEMESKKVMAGAYSEEYNKYTEYNIVQEIKKRLPVKAHNNWMKFKLENGWEYGTIKDNEKKTHPDLVCYDELPEVEKRKDDNSIEAYLFACMLWDKK
jgi:hypothetical protein